MNTLNLTEAAKFLRMNPQVLGQKAHKGLVPGRKTGKGWLFIEEHLADWVSGRYAEPARKVLVDDAEEKQCQSTNAVKRGTSNLPTKTDSEYNNLLTLKTVKKR